MNLNFTRIFTLLLGICLISLKAYSQTWESYDLQGNLKVRAVYDEIKVLGETVLIGKKDSSLSLLSRDLKPIVNLQGNEIYQYLSPWILVKGPKGIGAYHEYGQQALAPEYEEIQTYITRLLAKKGNSYWIFERGTGKITSLGTLENAKLTKLGMVIAQKQGKYYLPLSKDPGKPYDLLEENDGNYLLAKESSGYGIINLEGDYVLDPNITQLEYSRNNHFYGFNQSQYVLIKGDEIKADVSYNSYHKITKEGDLMLEYIHGKLRRVMKEDGILLDIVGMEEVQLVGKDHYFIRFREQKTGLLGKSGWLVRPESDAEWIGPGSEGLFPARKAGKSGFLNSDGRWVIQPTFTEVQNFSEQVGEFKSGYSWGLLSPSGQTISSPNWEEIKPFSSGKGIAKNSGGLFLIGKSGDLITQEPFDQICRIKDGYFLVEKSGKRGLLNPEGKQIIAPEFDFIQFENQDFILLANSGKVGVIKENGDMVFPMDYEEIIPDWTNNQILVKEMYTPVVIPVEEPSNGKRKKGA
ncbi:WG repeat protein [Algoriphagus boseongensis]|uniref:WG repeat protein n=1 Tax=Algoriphagus boseongensis TaxID=1442587 RepID=A0A4R6T873_9BACT|nr:WG repeat-containing protein [Algoriphagus boseongensis]TDQ18353.1 WG repeat protein [Algoriphagus boseongensis]